MARSFFAIVFLFGILYATRDLTLAYLPSMIEFRIANVYRDGVAGYIAGPIGNVKADMAGLYLADRIMDRGELRDKYVLG